jgi:threonine/homoserine/homoserine lactone efflux protein
MLSLQTLLALFAFALVSSVTPGPNNLMLMASGTNFGLVRTWPHLLGVTLGFTVMTLLVCLGLGAAFAAVPGAMLALKITSALYLLYLAWRIATAPPPSLDRGESDGKPLTFLQAAAFQWVNPKGWTMAMTAAAVYISADDRVVGSAIVTLVFLVVGVPTSLVWAVAGVQMRRLLHRPKAYRAFNVVAALLLVASLYPVVIPSG